MTQTVAEATLLLPVEINLENATQCSIDLSAKLNALCKNGLDAKVISLSAKEVDRFDSAALSVMLQFRRDALALGKDVKVVHMSSQLLELAKLYGVDALLTQAPEPA